MVSAQYVKKCLTYPHQIWYAEATGQDKRLALSYSGGVSQTVAIKHGILVPSGGFIMMLTLFYKTCVLILRPYQPVLITNGFVFVYVVTLLLRNKLVCLGALPIEMSGSAIVLRPWFIML